MRFLREIRVRLFVFFEENPPILIFSYSVLPACALVSALVSYWNTH